MGTEEIEGAILRDRQLTPDTPVGNCCVVGAPHREKGLTPLAFIVPVQGCKLTSNDRKRLDDLVRNEKGAVSVPEDYLEVSALPETRSGKYMRRLLTALVLGEPLGDTSTLRNPECLPELKKKVQKWLKYQQSAAEQELIERFRYFRVEYHPVKVPGSTDKTTLAVVWVTNPPVNALNERALDELNTVVNHLNHRADVKAIVFTGAGNKSFVAGADIVQMHDEIHTVEDAITLPHNAQLAFNKIEKMHKPCVAAINGVALGGGLEFTLVCHYRVADVFAEFGTPEINLKMLPGYGGTQRLPRLLAKSGNLSKAVEIVLGGRSIDAKTALEVGLVDQISNKDLDALAEACQVARDYLLKKPGNILQKVYEERKKMIAEWAKPDPAGGKAIQEVLKTDRVSRILEQGKLVGRGPAMARAVDCLTYGFENGVEKGLHHEAQVFAQAIIDKEHGGKVGIQEFLDKKAAPLPTRNPFITPEEEKKLLAEGKLLPVGAPFFPGITPLPEYMYAWAAYRDPVRGNPAHGDPIKAERQCIVPIERPRPMQATLYVLASEVNFNDIWAITGIPVSMFDDHDRDFHISGSGGICLVAALGEEVRREGRVKLGDLCIVYSGQSDILHPMMGLDPMAIDFGIQGYSSPDGSHSQFVVVQAPQVMPLPPDLTLEAAGSYCLNLGTAYRALFTTLGVQAHRSIFIEGAATGTGLDASRSSARNGLDVIGMVSSDARGKVLLEAGGKGYVNRASPSLKGIFQRIPGDPTKWAAWEKAGEPMLELFKKQNRGKLADYVVSHAGDTAFPRTFQLLATATDESFIPTATFYGASSGYHFTFMGKEGTASCQKMLQRAKLHAGEAVLIYYGITEKGRTDLVDPAGLEAIEAARVMGARIVAVTYTDAQREFVLSLGFGASLKGVVSIQEIKRRLGDEFDWPDRMPDLPDSRKDPAGLKEAVRLFNDKTFKPIGQAVGGFLRSADNPRGYPDLIIERANQDCLNVSAMLIKPFVGRCVYFENMKGRMYSYFAPQIWMRQRRVYMPTCNLWGTHLSNGYEILKLNDEISAGLLSISEPALVDWKDLPETHQAMWENRHTASTYIVNHALPRSGLKTKDELFEAWAEMGL